MAGHTIGNQICRVGAQVKHIQIYSNNHKSTFNENETIVWRQWHHWNKQTIFTSLKLSKGKHILTLKTVEKGNMNYDFIEFIKVK